MSRKTQWSIGQLFLWILVASLIASHLANFYQRRIVGFTDFQLDRSVVRKWLIELDATSVLRSRGGGASRSGNSVDSDHDYLISSKNATSEEIFIHLRKKISAQLREQGWSFT